MKISCKECGHEIDLDKSEKDLRIISERPRLGEVYVTCSHCRHDQRIAAFDQKTVDLIMERAQLRHRIEIAAGRLAFRKG